MFLFLCFLTVDTKHQPPHCHAFPVPHTVPFQTMSRNEPSFCKSLMLSILSWEQVTDREGIDHRTVAWRTNSGNRRRETLGQSKEMFSRISSSGMSSLSVSLFLPLSAFLSLCLCLYLSLSVSLSLSFSLLLSFSFLQRPRE